MKKSKRFAPATLSAKTWQKRHYVIGACANPELYTAFRKCIPVSLFTSTYLSFFQLTISYPSRNPRKSSFQRHSNALLRLNISYSKLSSKPKGLHFSQQLIAELTLMTSCARRVMTSAETPSSMGWCRLCPWFCIWDKQAV